MCNAYVYRYVCLKNKEIHLKEKRLKNTKLICSKNGVFVFNNVKTSNEKRKKKVSSYLM